jgi:glycosyltransferase involved in cell wall biosynthesis
MSLVSPRVVHVISDAGPHPWFRTLIEDGGAEREGLVVGSVGPAGALQDDMAELGVETFALDVRSRAGFPGATVRLAHKLRALRTDIVQTHLVDGCLVGLTAARLARVPVAIMTAHHPHELPFHGRRLLWPDRLCAGPLSDHIIAPSRDVAETMVSYLRTPRSKIEVVHHGFDLSRLNPEGVDGNAVRRELGLDGDVVLGSIGRLYWIKNQAALVRAFAAVAPDATLVLVGPGDQAPLRELAADLGVGDRVVLTGPRHDIPELLAAFDAFVHPAVAESFGMVIIEAMAMGRPIMSTPVGIARDVVDHETGVLTASASVSDLEKGLRDLLVSQAHWPALGAAASERARPFSATAMAAHYAQVYANLAAKRRF